MLYYLFDILEQQNVPGAGLFNYISFRAGAAILVSLIISWVLGGKIINRLRRAQVGETVRDLGLEGQLEKAGTPTMGGFIILAAVVIPTLLFARLDNIYIITVLAVTVILGGIGFLDDYIKVFKKDKGGLAGWFKVIGQVGAGLLLGLVMFFHPDVYCKKEVPAEYAATAPQELISEVPDFEGNTRFMLKHEDPLTTIPFVKGHEFNYKWPFEWFTDEARKWSWLLYIPMIIFIITAVSNAANLTDGIDGLATGVSAIIGAVLGVFAYISGNIIFANYLNIMYIPYTGELLVFLAGFIGGCIGFLWYNTNPAQVFMGDTGSLAIGGIIASIAIMVRKELLLPILCGIFVAESLSVIIQVAYFKYTKKKYGEGRRIFKMSPLHHHYQKLGFPEQKIVTRFWIVGLMLAVLTIITLKIR